MKLVVGLGNPGNEYKNSRHNVGFMVIDSVARQLDINISKEKDGGLYGEGYYEDVRVILLKPQKYVNLSGEVIKEFVDFYKLDLNDVLIISDDLDMGVGKIKLKQVGGSGGHNGLKNIELNFQTDKYQRLKIGISNNKLIETRNYVLEKFNKNERILINEAIEKATMIIIDFIQMDFLKLMNKYN